MFTQANAPTFGQGEGVTNVTSDFCWQGQSSTEARIRQEVLVYVEAGLSVIPCPRGSKSPAIPWAQYQTAAPDRAQVVEWLRRWPVGNWAVILGPVSGDLAVIDFDAVDDYERWALAWPDMAQLAPTVRTARGVHLYFILPGARSAKLAEFGGDLKAGGGYVLAPPSLHPSGVLYRWERGHVSGFVPQIGSLDEIGIAILQDPPQAARFAAGRGWRRWETDRLKPCAGAVLTSTTGEGARNVTAWRLALHLRSEGWSEAAALELMGPWWARSGSGGRELTHTVASAYQSNRQPGHGCRSAELAPFCAPSCPLARYRTEVQK